MFAARLPGTAILLAATLVAACGDDDNIIIDPEPERPGPIYPPPATLWRPLSGPSRSGRYVYLLSQSGDYIGAGATYIYTASTTDMAVTGEGPHLSVHVDGAQWWFGEFEAMRPLERLEPGYYPDLQRWPFHDPDKGGLSWAGDGRGCNELTGWFVVDTVSYAGAALSRIHLRFEQHCDGQTPALRGVVHWTPQP